MKLSLPFLFQEEIYLYSHTLYYDMTPSLPNILVEYKPSSCTSCRL